MKKVLVFDDNSKVFENQLKTIDAITFSTVSSQLNVESIFEEKPDLIIVNQNTIQSEIKEILDQPNPLPIILVTDNGPEKQTFEAWSSPAHIVRRGDWDQFKLTIKEILNFLD